MSVPFVLDPADATSAPVPDQLAAISGDGPGFVVTGYRPGRYRVRVPNSPPGWMFKAATLNGVDVSENPFELTRDVTDLVLTFTDRWSGIGGLVQGTGATAPRSSCSRRMQGSGPRAARVRGGCAAPARAREGNSA